MDQDFHYYGTYYAAKKGGFNTVDATLIAKAANFIDFFQEKKYAAYWDLVSDTRKVEKYNKIATMEYPRYTYQGDLLGSGTAPEDGLWCSYHFTPGNYDDPPGTPSRETVHGQDLANFLPKFVKRDTTKGLDPQNGQLLNRPQSALARQLIMDTIRCVKDDERVTAILNYSTGGNEILRNNREDNLARFKLILLGIRAHVIADTWAHQDFCGIHNAMNTYWDVNDDTPSAWSSLRQFTIDYDDGSPSGWKNTMLSIRNSKNLEAVPANTSYLGHGWMGHLPDFSFAKFRYKPCWSDPKLTIIRDNPQEYQFAWLELVSLFTQANGGGKINPTDKQFKIDLDKAITAITFPCTLAGEGTGRKSSAIAWQAIFNDLPSTIIDVDPEPDPNAVLDGMIEETKRLHRFGTHTVNIYSDLYLFQIAADYHFHFIKNYLHSNKIYQFTGSWSQQTSALSPNVSRLFTD